jgi:hypothetical protein
MVNIFPRAYFSEVLLTAFGLVAWVFVAWMVWSTGRDVYRAIQASEENKRAANPKWNFSVSLIFQGMGFFASELWRLFETTLLVGIGLWMMFHSIEGQPVEFWNLQENLRFDRVLAVMITGSKMMASLTARYFRRKANRVDGILHD